MNCLLLTNGSARRVPPRRTGGGRPQGFNSRLSLCGPLRKSTSIHDLAPPPDHRGSNRAIGRLWTHASDDHLAAPLTPTILGFFLHRCATRKTTRRSTRSKNRSRSCLDSLRFLCCLLFMPDSADFVPSHLHSVIFGRALRDRPIRPNLGAAAHSRRKFASFHDISVNPLEWTSSTKFKTLFLGPGSLKSAGQPACHLLVLFLAFWRLGVTLPPHDPDRPCPIAAEPQPNEAPRQRRKFGAFSQWLAILLVALLSSTALR